MSSAFDKELAAEAVIQLLELGYVIGNDNARLELQDDGMILVQQSYGSCFYYKKDEIQYALRDFDPDKF